MYTRGTKGIKKKALKELLNYFERTNLESAVNDDLKAIQKMVEDVKQDEEVSIEYMKIFEREKMLIEEGLAQGIEREVFNSIFENDYSIERGAKKLNLTIEKFEEKYQKWLEEYKK